MVCFCLICWQKFYISQKNNFHRCVGVNIAIQLLYLLKFLSRPGSTRVCSLVSQHLSVVEHSATLFITDVDRVVGPGAVGVRQTNDNENNIDQETLSPPHDCQPGVNFGRDANEPVGEHIPVYLAGTVLRVMKRRNAELKPFFRISTE